MRNRRLRHLASLLRPYRGRVIVMLDDTAAKERPSLELTQRPLAVLPFLQSAK